MARYYSILWLCLLGSSLCAHTSKHEPAAVILLDLEGNEVATVPMQTVKNLHQVCPTLEHNTIEIDTNGVARLSTGLRKDKLLFILQPQNSAIPKQTLPPHVQPNRYVPRNTVQLLPLPV